MRSCRLRPPTSRTTLLVLAMAGSACDPRFDLSRKIACRDDADCLGGALCVYDGGRLGTCVDPADPTDDALETGGADTDVAPPCVDRDGDGYFAASGCGSVADCDDATATVHAGAPEVCNGVDDDCDGTRDEGVAPAPGDIAHCGGCGLRCDDSHAEVVCIVSACRVNACDPDWWDRDGLGTTGCETPCGELERVCGDGRDDDCDGVSDAGEPDCDRAAELADRRFRLLIWHGGDHDNVTTGEVGFDASGTAARATRMQRSDVSAAGRGTIVPDGSWGLVSAEPGTLTVSGAGTTITLRRSVSAPEDLLVGFGGGDLHVLAAATEIELDPSGAWLSWVASPLNELDPVPGGGVDVLGWSEPAELSALTLAPLRADARGGGVWSLAETRSGLAGSVDALTPVAPIAYSVWGSGVFSLDRLARDGVTVERELFGGMVPAADFAFGVHRFLGGLCTGRVVTGGSCMHDPIVHFAMRRGGPQQSPAIAGSWRLVGMTYRAASDGGLDTAPVDTTFVIGSTGVITGAVTGSVGLFGRAESPVAPTIKLEVRGNPVGGGTLTLEGLISPFGYGLFWDQSGYTRGRPLLGGAYFLFRQ